MATPPISGSGFPSTTPPPDQASFDAALQNSQNNELTPELEKKLVEGGIVVVGQMLIMPRAIDILNEAMSDDE